MRFSCDVNCEARECQRLSSGIELVDVRVAVKVHDTRLYTNAGGCCHGKSQAVVLALEASEF